MKRLAPLLIALLGFATPALADYVVKDGNGNIQTVKAFNCSGTICPQMTPSDQFGNAFGTSGNPFFVNFPSAITVNQGTAGASPWLVTWSGNLGVAVSNFPATQAISAVSLPLPTGAATSALQTTGNTALGTINTTLGTPMQASGGSVTANAGTNLNTSLLALETGGNLASIKTDADTIAGAVSSSKMATKAASADFADCSVVVIGCKADAKSTATDTTAITLMQVMKEISAMEQSPASRAVTNAGTFPVQAPITSWAGGTLGAMANYGTSPGAVLVPGVNAYVTGSNPGVRTIVALDVATVTTGGTAVTALSAGHRTAGGWLQNPIGATINLCINEQGAASGTTSAGALTCIQPGQTYTLTPAAAAVSVITSDSSHPFSGYGLN
jgi:hypothetical protein